MVTNLTQLQMSTFADQDSGRTNSDFEVDQEVVVMLADPGFVTGTVTKVVHKGRGQGVWVQLHCGGQYDDYTIKVPAASIMLLDDFVDEDDDRNVANSQ